MQVLLRGGRLVGHLTCVSRGVVERALVHRESELSLIHLVACLRVLRCNYCLLEVLRCRLLRVSAGRVPYDLWSEPTVDDLEEDLNGL